MRILHVIRSINPGGGGPQTVAVSHCAALASRGHDVTLCAYGNPDDGHADTFRQQIPGFDRVKVESLGDESLLERLTARKARPRLAQLVQQSQIVHLHGVWEQLLQCVARAAREAHVHYLLTPHGMLKPWALSVNHRRKQLAMRLGARSMMNDSCGLHMLNDEEATLPEWLDVTAPTYVIPNGTWLLSPEQTPAAGAFRAKHPQLGSDPYIVFLSRIDLHKGLDLLVDAFAIVNRQLPNVRMVIAGPRTPDSVAVEAHAERVGLGDRIHLVGGMFGTDKYACLQDATVFALPSRNEGFPVAVLDALAMGVPSVISDRCFFPQVAQANCGRVVPLQVEPLAQALIEVLNNPTLRDSMSKAGRELVSTQFTWSAIAASFESLYEGLLSKPPKSCKRSAA